MPTICLNMIVRNEAHIVRETLESVRRYLTDYVVVDTGSTDGTIDVIRTFFAAHAIPGHAIERPWRNFGENRSEALQFAREHSSSDYLWVIDADDLLVGDLAIGYLDRDAYHLRYGPGIEYWRLQLFKRTASWRYVGVLHEYPTCTQTPCTTGYIPGDYYLESRRLGDRSKDPAKYLKDAKSLEAALREDPHNTRNVFYLAQSYFDAGMPAAALDEYRRRCAMGGWEQEIFYSRYRAAQCLERMGRPWEEVRAAYLDCFGYHPSRAEPLVRVATHERQAANFGAAYEYACRAAGVPRPGAEALFLQADDYDLRARDEQAIAAYYLGKYEEAFRVNAELLRSPRLAEAERARIEANRDFSVAHIKDRFLHHDLEIVNRVRTRPKTAEQPVTLTITTCRRLELFVKTVDSFLNACTDRERIARWICVDDNSSDGDRREMERRFPFFEFVWKGPHEKGHARSMNILRGMVQTPLWLHLEDDWHFFEPLAYIETAMEILDADDGLGQVLFNRHYAEGIDDRQLVGGTPKRTPLGQRYVEHLYLPAGTAAQEDFYKRHPGGRSNVWWPHYSLRPSLSRTSTIHRVGPYDEQAGHFELEFAWRYERQGFRSAFLDTICCLHIGRRTTERGGGALSAYELNRLAQFDAPPIRVKLLANWCTSEALCALWNKMAHGAYRWGRVEITWDDRDVDFYAIFNAPRADAHFVPERTIVFHMEPRVGIAALPAPWRHPDPARFYQVRSHDLFPNVSEWHLGKSYDELLDTPIVKNKVLSSVTSSRYVDPGQRKRVDFIKHLERLGMDIDVFGRGNDVDFQNYRGPLPPFRKEGGLFPYKYTFAAENYAEKNYFTEKLVDAILSECLCFYWGCPNLADYIDPRAYIRVDLDDFDAAAHTMATAITQGEWERRIQFIRHEKRKILDEYQVFPTLERIVTDAHASLVRKARRLRVEGSPLTDVAEAYERAFREDPTRAEPLWELAQALPDHAAKCRALERVKDLPQPPRGAGERDLYDWRILDGLAMHSYYAGRYADSFAAYDELLQRPSLPPGERPRIEANLQFTLTKLPLPDIVVVNLDRRPDRLAGFRRQAVREGLTAYRRVAAVDGRQLSLTDAIRHLFRGNDFGYRRGIVGCALSHLRIWRSLAQPALIFEDDVELSGAFLFKLQSVLRQARHLDGPWDIVFLGWHPWAALDAEVSRHTAQPTLIRMPWPDFMGGSFAYLLSPSGAAKLWQRAHERGVQNGIDWFVMHHADCLYAYRTALPIAWSAAARKDGVTDSDIQYDWAPLD